VKNVLTSVVLAVLCTAGAAGAVTPMQAERIEQLKKDCMFLKVLGSYPRSQ
jgi:prephenate dehydratase